MKIINYFFIAYFISILPANAQLFGGQIKTKNPLLNQYPAGSVFCNGPTAIVDVINPTTGKVWMDRNLGASRVATSSSDSQAYGDLYQWGRRSDGHQCRNSSTTTIISSIDQPTNNNFIYTINSINEDWRNPQNNNLWQGVNGINNPCPNGYRLPTETEFNSELSSWTINTKDGAYASPLKLPVAGYRSSNSILYTVGIYGNYWSSSVNGRFSRYLYFDLNSAFISDNPRGAGESVRCIKEPGLIGTLNCSNSTLEGNLVTGQAATNVNLNVSYTGGNSSYYLAQSINSTGITGLIATLSSGNFANGNGTLSFVISGTPLNAGTASFALDIGGQACILNINVIDNFVNQYPAGSVFCNVPTAIVDVTNPTTGKIWMDRNLGASQVATSSTDALAYGDLYQWGRGNDGHQCRNSSTTSALSSTDQAGNGSFITASSPNSDWRSPQNNNLWQGVNGVNNPCPSGYRLPTETELNAEITSWSSNNAAGAFVSPLKLTMTGGRDNSGDFADVGTIGRYWSSTVGSTYSHFLFLYGSAFMNTTLRVYAFSVRCIKDASAIPPTVGALNCGSTSIIGTLTSGTAASGVSAYVPYTSGNSGSYLAQSFSSTGVTGLTATLTSGNLANGSGSLSFAISGTPSTSGSAIFALTIGGQTCSFTISVQPALAVQYPVSSVFCASGPTAIVDVTNPTTGKVWMDRNLGASQAATSSTDTAAYGDLYQWGRRSDGHQCRNSAATSILSNVDQPLHGNHIVAPNSPFDWRSPQNTDLWQGVNGVNNPCPSGYRLPTEVELNEERLSWSSNNSVGAFASPLKFTMAGGRHYNNNLSLVNVGTLGDYYSSTISSTNSRNLCFESGNAYMNSDFRADGDSVRCIKDASAIPPTVGALNCGSTSFTGTLTNGIAASGVSLEVPYTGGNGGSYATQSVSSTGVTGLTAALTSGTLAFGSGTLSFAISGTPVTSGTASFALTLGGQSCSFTISVQTALAEQYPANSVFCASGPTAIVDVTNPTTGRIWMDRNLGASQAATSSTDTAAYGDLYQWGRRSDGHQCRTSPTTTTLSSNDQPANGNFIFAPNSPNDWRSPQNTNLWQGVNGLNNPCPSGYRLPTITEINTELTSWSANNSLGAFSSNLKLPITGFRSSVLNSVGSAAYYWSSTFSGSSSRGLGFDSNTTFITTNGRADGYSVRCIKN